jgi:hypothetical protein
MADAQLKFIRDGAQPSLLNEARQMVGGWGCGAQQLINVAVAEKLSALRTQILRGSRRPYRRSKAFVILKRAGVGNPPMKGDKLARARKRA